MHAADVEEARELAVAGVCPQRARRDLTAKWPLAAVEFLLRIVYVCVCVGSLSLSLALSLSLS